MFGPCRGAIAYKSKEKLLWKESRIKLDQRDVQERYKSKNKANSEQTCDFVENFGRIEFASEGWVQTMNMYEKVLDYKSAELAYRSKIKRKREIWTYKLQRAV